jgi:HEAT repeat protein
MRTTLVILSVVFFQSGVRAGEPTFHGKTFAQWSADLQHRNEKVRSRAVTALGLGPFGDSAVPLLVIALADSDDHVRNSAITMLGSLGPRAKPAIPGLVSIIEERRFAGAHPPLQSLCRIGPEAAPAVLTVLPRVFLDWCDISSLLMGMGPAIAPDLARALEKPEKDRARLHAKAILREFGPQAAAAVPILIAIVEKKKALACSDALEVLQGIGPGAAPAIPVLVKLLDDNEHQVDAITVLLSIGDAAKPAVDEALATGPKPVREAILAHRRTERDDPIRQLLTQLQIADTETRVDAACKLDDRWCDLMPHLAAIRKATKDADPRVRKRIYHIVANFAGISEEMAIALAEGLLDSDEDVRFAVYLCLRDEPVSRGTTTALIRALRDRRADVRVSAAHLLRRVDPENRLAVKELSSALRDGEADVRNEAALSLAYLGQAPLNARRVGDPIVGDVHIPALQALLKDPSERVRLSAALALCRLGQPNNKAIQLLAQGISQELEATRTYAEFRHLYPIALSTCRHQAALAVPILEKNLEDSRLWVRTHAVEGLEALGPVAHTAIPTLVKAMQDKEEKIQERAAAALAKMGDAAAPALKQALQTGESWLKRIILENLPRDLPPTHLLLDEVERLLADANPSARGSALSLLVQFPERHASLSRKLDQVLDEMHFDPAHWPLDSLARLGAAAVPYLTRRLIDPDERVRRAVTSALGAADPGGELVLPALLETLGDPEPEVRAMVLATLGKMGPAAKPVVGRVREAMRDPSTHVAAAACLALWQISREMNESMRVLHALRRNSDGGGRVDAVLAMRSIDKNPDQLTMLVELLQDEDGSTRFLAECALKELAGEARPVVPAVEGLLNHRADEVRRSALWVLFATKKERKESRP